MTDFTRRLPGMGVDHSVQHSVRWHTSDTGADPALVAHVADLFPALAGGAHPVVSTGRLCPSCGSSGHGRPWLTLDGVSRHVSLARSGPHLVTVIATAPVGVDVESVSAVASAWDPALVLAPGERAGTDAERARTWARKEAVLKRRGTGLATPMPDVVLETEAWHDLAAPPGYVAAISVAVRGGAAP